MEKREYVGKNIKLGWMYTFMLTNQGMITGETIYIANADGLYYGIGGMDGAIWIQSLPDAPHENADLFIRGVEIVDKYAPEAKRERCFKVLDWLSKQKYKTGIKYCRLLNFFWELGAGRDFNTTYQKYRNFMN